MSSQKRKPTSALRGLDAGSGSDHLLGLCDEWLSLDGEIGRLSCHWAKLEARLVREHGWVALSTAERSQVSDAREMLEVELQMKELVGRRDRGLEHLAQLEATSIAGVAGKLTVAERLLQDEAGAAYRLIADCVREINPHTRFGPGL